MRLRIAPLALITLLVAACTHGIAGASSAASPATDTAQIRYVLDSVTATGWNTGNLDMYLSAYVDSATTMLPTGVVTGRDAIGDVMRKGFWRSGRPLQQLHYEHVNVRMLGSDDALVTGEFVLTGAGRPDRTGWFTTVWTRTAQGWRMIHDHS